MAILVRIGLLILGFVALMAIATHTFNLVPPPGQHAPPGVEFFSVHWARYLEVPRSTHSHLLVGLLFVLALPIQFSRKIRSRAPRLHRWGGRFFVLASLGAGISGMALGIWIPFGGALESWISTGLGVLLIYAVTRGFIEARRKKFILHRVWMIRSVAIGLSIASMRVVNLPLYYLQLMPDRLLFSVTLVLGMVANLFFVEAYLRRHPRTGMT